MKQLQSTEGVKCWFPSLICKLDFLKDLSRTFFKLLITLTEQHLLRYKPQIGLCLIPCLCVVGEHRSTVL